jgi:tripartite-type tricarboxylate transporter receptor subunit TctC
MKVFVVARCMAALCCLPALVSAANAQDWPAHALRIVVPFPPGGSADVQSRLIASELAASLGQPVVVENKPGAGGNIAAAYAAHAGPDGYTLFMGTTGTNATNISLYAALPFDPAKDFAPLTLVTFNPQLVISGLKHKATGLDGLIADLKQAGASASYGSSGIGSATHLAGELFNSVTGTAMVHVPYRGQGPALTDLLSGQIDAMFPLVADVLPFAQSGKINVHAIMSARRAKTLPDVPTTAELGYGALRLGPIWTALYTNAGTPKPVIDRLSGEIARIIAAPQFRDKFEALGYDVRSSSPEELASFAAAETARWGGIIKRLNVHLDQSP